MPVLCGSLGAVDSRHFAYFHFGTGRWFGFCFSRKWYLVGLFTGDNRAPVGWFTNQSIWQTIRFTGGILCLRRAGLRTKRGIHLRLVLASSLHPIVGCCFVCCGELYVSLADNDAHLDSRAGLVYDRCGADLVCRV